MKKLALYLTFFTFTIMAVKASTVSFETKDEWGLHKIILCSEEEWLGHLPKPYHEMLVLPASQTYPLVRPEQTNMPHMHNAEQDVSALTGALFWNQRVYPLNSHFIPWSDTFISSNDICNGVGMQVRMDIRGTQIALVWLLRDIDLVRNKEYLCWEKDSLECRVSPVCRMQLFLFNIAGRPCQFRLVSECLSPQLLDVYELIRGQGFSMVSLDVNRAYSEPCGDSRSIMIPYPSLGFSADEFLALRQKVILRKQIKAPDSAVGQYVQNCYWLKLITSNSRLRTGAQDYLNPWHAEETSIQYRLYPPMPEPDGRVQTLNNMGGMTPVLDKASQEFIDHCVKYVSPMRTALEIGTSYGLVVQKIVEQGGMHVVANDADWRHLAIMARRLGELCPDYPKRVSLKPGKFPGCFMKPNYRAPDTFYDAILAARVFHFMNPVEAREAFQACYDLLDTGGRFFAVMLTPYVKAYYKRFMPIFEERVKRGELFPGYVENLADYADPELIPPSEQKNKGLAQPFMFFDEVSARRILEEVGFVDIEVSYAALPYPSKLWAMPEIGKENLLVKAFKPIA